MNDTTVDDIVPPHGRYEGDEYGDEYENGEPGTDAEASRTDDYTSVPMADVPEKAFQISSFNYCAKHGAYQGEKCPDC